MKKFKEYMDEMTTRGWIAFVTITLLAFIFVAGAAYYYVQNPNTWPVSYFTNDNDDNKKVLVKSREVEDDKTTELIKRATDAAFSQNNSNTTNGSDTKTTSNTQTGSTSASPVSYQYQKEEVRIALIIAKNEYDVQNVISGRCGDVYMVTAFVIGPTVLTNSIKALFGNKVYGDFLPGNIIPTYHPDLYFKDVTIQNGTARIYLTGSFSNEVGTCDNELAIAQLTETSKYYPTVSSVELYLNGSKIN